MAQLIKLESGQYLNLDNLINTETRTEISEERGLYDDGYTCHMTNGGSIHISPKDLEKIDQIADYDTIKNTWQRAEAIYRDAPDD